jgi:hypothetical protein
MSDFREIQKLGDRLKKIGIHVTFSLNVPWVYLNTINGKRVTETTPDSNHGFNVGWLPVQIDKPFYFSNIKNMFKIIRKYAYNRD